MDSPPDASSGIATLLERLEAVYGRTDNPHRLDPMEELVSCILSQHTADANSMPAYYDMRRVFPTWDSLANASVDEIARTIKRAGLANQKAKSILGSIRAIRERTGSYSLSSLRSLPLADARAWLQSLPGVGPKTAAIVLCFALDRGMVPVDTHVFRVGKRLGLIPETVTADAAHDVLLEQVPGELAFRLHMALIQHGRTVCRAPKPNCQKCPIRDACPYPGTQSMSMSLVAPDSGSAILASLPVDAPLEQISRVASQQWQSACDQVRSGTVMNLSATLSQIAEQTYVHLLKRLDAKVDLLALGSLALRDMAPLDETVRLMFLGDDRYPQADLEQQAQAFAKLIGQLDLPFQTDFVTRGLLAWTYTAFENFELERMSLLERFEIGQARLIWGDNHATELTRKAAYAVPITPERLRQLVNLKNAVEEERNTVRYFRRNVQSGYGGLDELLWFVHLYELRYPTALGVEVQREMRDRIRSIGRARLLNALEVERLIEAYLHLVNVRNWLQILGIGDGHTTPENPDKLRELALAMGLSDGNAFLRRHEAIVDNVHGIFAEGLERLKVEV